eukprot:gene2358-2664_t
MQSNLHLMRQSSSLWRSEQSLEKQRTGHPHDLATRALAKLASIDPGHVRPQGIASLWGVWAVVAAALGMAQAAHWAFRKALGIGWFSSCTPLAAQLTDAVARQECSSAHSVPSKEGFEDMAAQAPVACTGEDEDDVTTQKRRAQAEAAAQRVEYRSQLQLVLSGLGKSGKVADDAQALFRLADQLFGSPVNVPEFVEQGGVPIIIKAADRALQELSRKPYDSATLPLLLQAASDDVMAAVLQPSSLHGLGYLLHHRPQLSGRLQGLVMGQLHYLITVHPSELLELLITEHLVGCFASGMVKKLGRLFVCQLLSSRGQEVMVKIEDQYELDVALALAEHTRLDELLSAFWEELPGAGEEAVAHAAGDAGADAGAEPASCEQQLPPVCVAVLSLVRHLMSQGLSLQAVPHVRGDSIDESLSSTSSGSCIDAALSIPDESGVYSAVLSEQQRMPAHAVSSSSQRMMVVFRFGHLEHSVQQQMYKQIRQSSKFVHSLLSKSCVSRGCPVTVLGTPHFTPEANRWVLQCLERWLSTGELRGFSAAQACKLWVAADFLQVNGLQAACEDVMAAGFAADASGCEVATALELCSRHTNSSSRLQRLVAQALMRSCSAAGAQQRRTALLQLQSLKDSYREVLLPAVREEVRDSLVTLCMLNAGCDDDMPEEIVE